MIPVRSSLHSASFLLLLSVLGLSLVVKITDFQARNDPSLLRGEWVGQLEDFVDANVFIKQFAVNFWAALDLVVFHEGRKGVVVGKDGWLYSDEEFYQGENANAAVQNNIAYIADVHKQLLSAQIQLVVVLVPAKADVYPQFLDREKPTAFMQQLYQTIAATLLDRVSNVVDLRNAYQLQAVDSPVFLRTDTHWTPHGAELAAASVATLVDSLSAELNPKQFETQRMAQVPYLGDLSRFLPLTPYFSRLLPEQDLFYPRQTQAVGDADPNMGLFGDDASEVVLIGTSYSANPNWNFTGALQQSMQVDVVNYAEEGVGPIVPMVNYLASEDYRQAAPKMIIWEVPVRYIAVDYSMTISQRPAVGMDVVLQ